MEPLEGLTAIITGAASGIGASLSRLFAGAGALVAMVDCHSDNLQSVAESINGTRGNVSTWELDLARSRDIHQTIETIGES